MKNQHPENRDPAPKRRKARDNPYEIFTVGFQTEHPHFFVHFIDSVGELQCLEISRNIYAVLNRFELDDLSFLNEVDNHYEHSELTESSLHQRTARHPQSVEETVMMHIQSAIVEYIDCCSSRRIRAKTKWMPPFNFWEASMMNC